MITHCLVPVARQGEMLRVVMTTESPPDLLPADQADPCVGIFELPMVARGDLLSFLERHTIHDITLRENMVQSQDLYTQTDALGIAEMLAPRKDWH